MKTRSTGWMLLLADLLSVHEDTFVAIIVSATSSLTLRGETLVESMEKLVAAYGGAASCSNFQPLRIR